MSTGVVILFGCLGGLIPDALALIQSGNREKAPEYLKKPWWWITLVLTIGLGGLTAALLDPTSKLDAFAYGFLAPELVRRVVGAAGNRIPTGTPAIASTNRPVTEYLA